ncbi:MAG: aminotransferase class IV family protein [Phycisphaeraceae bacterium]|nr:aminotransferase class IV family protein [Phycisphaeraceae bacterium]
MTTVFLNGRLLSPGEARVSAFDAAVQHGVGLFETMTARRLNGHTRVFLLEEHLDRMIGSARELGLSDALRAPALAEAITRTVEASELDHARVRLTITGGDLNLLGRARTQDGGGAAPVEPTVLIVAQPATVYPEEMFEHGASATIADLKVNPLDPLAGHKTINYWGRLRELQLAAAKKAGEGLVLQVTNHVCGGCVSNVFLVTGEGSGGGARRELVTPIARGEEASGAIPSPVLPGVTRGWLLEWAGRRRLPVRKRLVTIEDVLKADEVFLTNSSWGVMPVVRVEKHEVGDGEVGEVARDALEAWREAQEATG